MKLNFNFSGKTLLKDWWKIVRDNFTAIQTDHNELSDSVNTHKTAEVIDHPDKSVTSTKIADKAIHTEHIANYAITKDKVVNGAVTTDKIADKSITVNKLALDIVADLGKANTFLYSDGEPICLSEYKNTSGGYEVPDIPVNVFFKLENDTDSILTKFQTADDHYTTLSCDIAPGEVRICVLIQKEVSGADPQNGYLFVLDDNSIRKLLNGKAPTNHASNGTGFGKGTRTAFGHVKLSEVINSSTGADAGIAVAPKAVKTAYDKAVSAYELADGKLDANFVSNGYAGIDEVTTTLNDMWSDRVAPPTTITISSSTSKHMLTADYYCSGTNDQTVINNAISALPSTGGKIVLLEGTYNISGQINVNKPNVTICGMGNSTVLQRKFDGNNVIYVTSANCELAYFKVDGDSATYTNTANCNIQTYGAGYQNIHDITTVNATDCGIKIRNVCHYSNIYNISADGNKIGILFDGTTGAKVCKNTVTNSTATGILLSWNTRDCVVAENVVDTATTYGICIENTSTCVRNVVANNVVRNSATNIYVNNSYNIVACNMVEPETGQKTIHVGSSGKYNYVTGNYIYSINYTNDGGTTNTFSNNKYS